MDDATLKVSELTTLYPRNSRTRDLGGGRVTKRVSFHPDVAEGLATALGEKNNVQGYLSPLLALGSELVIHVLTEQGSQRNIAEKLVTLCGVDPLWLAANLERLASEVEQVAWEASQDE